MATAQYMDGRKKYARPQALLFSENPGRRDPETGLWLPEGLEVGVSDTESDVANQFIVLSDDNRQPIDISTERIEIRQRTINGRMRSYHVADKRNFSVSWQRLPSRAFSDNPLFNSETGKSDLTSGVSYTSDNGAGGVEILDWYNSHQGSFWVYLAYDNYTNFENDRYNRLSQYNEVVEVFFSDFSYSVEKRGRSNHDYWNISLALEEV
jgi:hypothetical protein